MPPFEYVTLPANFRLIYMYMVEGLHLHNCYIVSRGNGYNFIKHKLILYMSRNKPRQKTKWVRNQRSIYFSGTMTYVFFPRTIRVSLSYF